MPDGKQSKKLTSTPGEWFVIIQTSRILDNNLLVELTDEDLQNMQYHDRTCYPVTSVLVKDKNQLKSKQNKTQKVLLSANYLLLKVSIKDEKLILRVMQRKILASFVMSETVNVQTNVFELKILNLQFPRCL